MKILMVVPYVPNVIRVRPYQFVRHLHARGHTLTVAALWSSDDERRNLEALAEMGVRTLGARHTRLRALGNCLRALPGGTPLQAAYCDSPALIDLLRAEFAAGNMPYDAIHVEHLRGSAFLLALREMLAGMGAARPRLVWDSVDCISMLFEQAARQSASRRARLVARVELERTRRHEARLLRAADHTIVTAAQDADALRALAAADGQAGVPCLSVVPNGVDTVTFCPVPAAHPHAPARIIFSGKMSYHANATAALYLARSVMPIVWAAQPEAELWIAGKEPGPELTALANPQAAARRVVVTGEVPSMAALLQQATVAAAPVIYGAGVQNKVLEAMACGVPVVASSRAVAALDACPGRDLLVADTPGEFAQQILSLLAAPAQREAMGAAGRAYVLACHSWDTSAARLEAIYAGEPPLRL